MPAPQKGLTLLELVIVMVILVTVASMAIPFVYRSFSAQRVNKAADLVRAQLNRARVAAMRTGEIQGFFYYPETPNFRVGPFNSDIAQSLNQSLRNQGNVRASNFDYDDDKLPQGVVFAEGASVDDSRSAAAQLDSGADLGGSVLPVLFYPDGSSQTAKVILRSDQNDYYEIKLRGMTGTSTAGPVSNIRSSGSGNR